MSNEPDRATLPEPRISTADIAGDTPHGPVLVRAVRDARGVHIGYPWQIVPDPASSPAPAAGDDIPMIPNTRVTFGPDDEPGTIAAVVMRRGEAGGGVWEYDIRADGDGRLVACHPYDVKLLPLDLDQAAAALADNGIDGSDLPYNPRALAAMRAADALLAELAYRRAELEQQAAELDQLRDELEADTADRREAEEALADIHAELG